MLTVPIAVIKLFRKQKVSNHLILTTETNLFYKVCFHQQEADSLSALHDLMSALSAAVHHADVEGKVVDKLKYRVEGAAGECYCTIY